MERDDLTEALAHLEVAEAGAAPDLHDVTRRSAGLRRRRRALAGATAVVAAAVVAVPIARRDDGPTRLRTADAPSTTADATTSSAPPARVERTLADGTTIALEPQRAEAAPVLGPYGEDGVWRPPPECDGVELEVSVGRQGNGEIAGLVPRHAGRTAGAYPLQQPDRWIVIVQGAQPGALFRATSSTGVDEVEATGPVVILATAGSAPDPPRVEQITAAGDVAPVPLGLIETEDPNRNRCQPPSAPTVGRPATQEEAAAAQELLSRAFSQENLRDPARLAQVVQLVHDPGPDMEALLGQAAGTAAQLTTEWSVDIADPTVTDDGRLWARISLIPLPTPQGQWVELVPQRDGSWKISRRAMCAVLAPAVQCPEAR